MAKTPTPMLSALAALKDVAKAFAPLATIGAELDRVMALVAHEDELKASIETKLATLRQTDADTAQKLADCDAEIARRQQVQTDAEAGYVTKLAALDSRYRAAKAAVDDAAADADTRIREAIAKADTEIGTLTADTAAARARITADHAAFIEDTKARRATIESNTAILEATLRDMRAQAHAALGAVEGSAPS